MKDIFKKIVLIIITFEAKLILKRYNPKIIAITGSVGKTSTKDAIYTVLSKFYRVRKSEKSFNSEIGLPLTILGCPNGWSNPVIWLENIFKGFMYIIWKQSYPEWLVLEMGVGKPGDMKRAVSWVKSDIVVLTRFPDVPVHVEFFESSEDIVKEKMYLAESLKEKGILVVNNDDEAVMNSRHRVKRITVSYGFGENATYRAVYPEMSYELVNGVKLPKGANFKLLYSGNTFPVSLNHIVGNNNIYCALVAIAVANEIGCDLLQSIDALVDYRTPPGRLSVIEGLNGSAIIDDSYNSSPVAMESALDVLESIEGGRKIAVLGDMLELGKLTEEAHKKIGARSAQIASMIVLVGPRAKFIGDGAREAGFSEKEIYFFDNSVTAGKFLNGVVEKGDIVLVKGSQGVRMERAIEAIMAHPEEKSKVLPRQEKEWRGR
jgi:UDP-N-acetylmuramoyl-tripeptide--D-alanyl-D-alanine ligase